MNRLLFGTPLALFLVISVILPCDLQPVKAEPSNIIATCGQGYLRDIDGLLVLNVKGSPYEMGYQHGFLLRDSVQAAIRYDMDRWTGMYERRLEYAQAMEQHIPQEYIDEIRGLADGAGMNYTDVLIYQCIELPYLGCSGFVVFGNATVDGRLYHGRNADMDFPPDIRRLMTGLVIAYEPEKGNRYVVATSPCGTVRAHSGMNEEGTSVGMALSPSRDVTPNGMSFGLMLKKVLQYSGNLTQAIDIICQTPRTSGWNIILGDGKNRNAAAVEISANCCKVFWPGDPAEDVEPHYSIANAARRTNHYVDPELAATQRDPYGPRLCRPGWNNSWVRYETLSKLIEQNYCMIDAEKGMQFMRTPPVAWDPINLSCMLFDPAHLELWVACANSTTPAYLREFTYLSWDDLFPQYDLTISSTPEVM